MGMGQDMLDDAMIDHLASEAEDDQYERRVIDTGARRLAYLLHSNGILSERSLADWLYPDDEAMTQAEQGAMP